MRSGSGCQVEERREEERRSGGKTVSVGLAVPHKQGCCSPGSATLVRWARRRTDTLIVGN